MNRITLLLSLFFLTIASVSASTQFNILNFGAKADGETKDTKALQSAIDACTQNGGGTVIIPAGKTIITGTFYLKNHVNLHIESGAKILGSPDIADYTTDTHKNMYKNEPHMDRCLIFARDAHDFSIDGDGTIDGNGHPKYFTSQTGRPMLIRFLNCQSIV